MSKAEEMKLSERIIASIRKAQREMVERKIKLGEPVVIADENGQPLIISAEEALKYYK